MDISECNAYELKAQILQHYISHWREYAKNRKTEWKKSIIIDSKINHLKLKKALKYWHEWSKHKYHNKSTIKYKNSTESMRIITMKRCIRFWHDFVERNYLSQKQYFKASAFYNIKQQQLFIADWRYLTQKKKNLNQKYQQIAQMNNNNNDQSFHIFNEWKNEYQHVHNQYILAKNIYQKNLKTKILIAFKTNTKYQHEIQQKLNDVIFGESGDKHKERTNKNELQNAYSRWKHKTMEMKSIKNNIDNETRKNLLYFWRSNTLKQQRLRYIEHKLKMKNDEIEKRKVLNEWKSLLMENQQTQNYLLSNYINFWYLKSKKQRELKLKYKILNEWICMRLLNKLWLKWYLLTQDQIEINAKMEISIDFHSNKCKSMLFIQWKQYIIKSKKEKKIIKKIKNLNKKRLKRTAFLNWYFHHKTKQIQTRLLKLTLIKFWNDKTKEEKHRLFNKRKANLFCINLYFTKWINNYEPFKIGNQYEKQLLLSIKPYIDSRNKRLLFNGIKTWRFVTIQEKVIKQNIKKQAFTQWKVRILRKKRMEHKILNLEKLIKENAKKQAFSRWKLQILNKQRLEQKILNIQILIRQNSQKQAFFEWYHQYKIKEIQTRLMEFTEQNTKKRAFSKWKNTMKDKHDLYLWNKSIVLDVVNNVFEAEKKEIEMKNKAECTMNKIELSLKDLLHQKLNFKQNCQKFVKFGSKFNVDLKLEKEIKEYLSQKKERQEQIMLIIRDISSLYDLIDYI